MTRPVQYFTKEYLETCKKMSPTAIAKYLEEFRVIAGASGNSGKQKLISIRIPDDMLIAFRNRCKLEQVPYQTKIKELMRAWLVES